MHGPNWTSKLQKQKNGQYESNLTNAITALRATHAREFWYDAMTLQIMRRIYGATYMTDEFTEEQCYDDRPLTEDDLTLLQQFLQDEGMRHMPRQAVTDAVTLIAREKTRHPVLEYLANRKWDGTPRLNTWLSKYLGAEQSDYTAAIGRMFLISMVARVRKPGCKADHMMVLEGEQGILKSTSCEVLAGEYFSDQLPDIATAGKDASQHLRGKWLIEVAELSSMGRAENALLKSFITRREERYRPPYGRVEVQEKRQCVFVGTTNKSTYLKDETGGRRLWPVKCGTIDIEALRRDRDQLFAEAVHAFNEREKWWPDRAFEKKHIQPQQEERFEADPWEEKIAEWVDMKVDGQPRQRTTIGEIGDFLGITISQSSRMSTLRIADSLQRLGWRKRKKKQKGKTVWERDGILI
ncbi:virulence-associated E family protein [Sinorhizobium medicae]|nr:virulence-associated E family protein [Sinorhizobium medicae]